jgi:hypothetical protein
MDPAPQHRVFNVLDHILRTLLGEHLQDNRGVQLFSGVSNYVRSLEPDVPLFAERPPALLCPSKDGAYDV